MHKFALLLSMLHVQKALEIAATAIRFPCEKSHHCRREDSMASPTRKVDPRVKRTRQLLQQAFNKPMQEKDFSAISIQDIAEGATVNRTTFHAHFEDRYQLLDYTIQKQLQQMVESKLPQVPRWEESPLRILIRAMLEYFRDVYTFHHCPSTNMLDSMVTRATQ
jgi:AcrR family transcriptional regulator